MCQEKSFLPESESSKENKSFVERLMAWANTFILGQRAIESALNQIIAPTRISTHDVADIASIEELIDPQNNFGNNIPPNCQNEQIFIALNKEKQHLYTNLRQFTSVYYEFVGPNDSIYSAAITLTQKQGINLSLKQIVPILNTNGEILTYEILDFQGQGYLLHFVFKDINAFFSESNPFVTILAEKYYEKLQNEQS